MNCLLYADGRRVDAGQIVGNGSDGFIIQTGESTVIKIPHLYGRLYPDGTIERAEDYSDHVTHLENEKNIYERLKHIPGVTARCVGISENGISLEYYRNGSLEDKILRGQQQPDLSQKSRWITEVVDAVTRCHEERVLIFDIALRNFLFTDDWSIRIIDFANSILLVKGSDVAAADDDGYTAAVDMLHLGSVIYSIVTWQKFSLDCARESEWPDVAQMPSTDGIPYGYVVADCWGNRYASIHDLRKDVQDATNDLMTNNIV